VQAGFSLSLGLRLLQNREEVWILFHHNALNTLQFFSLSQEQREHALLCASLLADQLGLSS
jgi:hypothetical protein